MIVLPARPPSIRVLRLPSLMSDYEPPLILASYAAAELVSMRPRALFTPRPMRR